MLLLGDHKPMKGEEDRGLLLLLLLLLPLSCIIY